MTIMNPKLYQSFATKKLAMPGIINNIMAKSMILRVVSGLIL